MGCGVQDFPASMSGLFSISGPFVSRLPKGALNPETLIHVNVFFLSDPSRSYCCRVVLIFIILSRTSFQEALSTQLQHDAKCCEW